MKASIFASVLSLSVISLAVNAMDNSAKPLISKQSLVTAKIDLNKADIQILSNSIKGIGRKRAEAIVKYRVKHGNFKSVEELAKVKGFSNRFVKNHLKQLQDMFSVN